MDVFYIKIGKNFIFICTEKVYNITYNYNLDGVDEINNQNTYTVFDGFKLNNPSKEGYTFIGWYLNGESINSINFNKSNEFNSFEEFKSEMDNRISGDITLEARWRQEEYNINTMVYAVLGSEYKITIPKTIVLSGNTKQAQYNVKVEGDIAGIEAIQVVPDETVTLNSVNKNSEIGNISQDKISWKYNEFDISANGIIEAANLTAGKWSGSFNFNINLANDDNNINSEESVEYHTFNYPSGDLN